MSESSSSVDFSTLSDADLQTAFNRINRERYPANFEACVRELERRRLTTSLPDGGTAATPPKVRDWRKAVRGFGWLYVCGGSIGAVNFLSAFSRGGFTGLQYAIGAVFIAMHMFAVYSGWKLTRLNSEGIAGVRFLAGVQCVAFVIGGYGFQFFCGLSFRLGIFSSRLGFHGDIGGAGALILKAPSHGFTLAVDLFAIAVLAILHDYQRSLEDPPAVPPA